MKITLIRHTSLQIAPGICYGQSDIDVAEHFMQEVNIAKQKLDAWQFDAIFSSPLQRCVKLAEALNYADFELDERLKELHFGDWEMQDWNAIPRELFDTWAQNYAELAPPNGETFSQLQQRGMAFLEEMQARYPEQHLLLVTHGGMIRALLAHVLNMPLRGLFRFNIDYASVTQLDFSGAIPKINFVNS